MGTLGTDLGNREELETSVLRELVALRGSFGRLTIEKFTEYEELRRVCGGGDLLDAFLMFEREMRRYIALGSRDAAAAAISITADADKVVDRLEYVLQHFETEGKDRDQRTARRWSDHGLKSIASELVYLAEVQGRLGGELLTIELGGSLESGLSLVLWHLTSKNLPDRAPIVRFWMYQPEADLTQDRSITHDLDKLDAPESSSAAYRLKCYRIQVEIPEDLVTTSVRAGATVYLISIEGRDAPMRTVSFTNDSDLGENLAIRLTTYRTHATLEVIRRT